MQQNGSGSHNYCKISANISKRMSTPFYGFETDEYFTSASVIGQQVPLHIIEKDILYFRRSYLQGFSPDSHEKMVLIIRKSYYVPCRHIEQSQQNISRDFPFKKVKLRLSSQSFQPLSCDTQQFSDGRF